MSKSITEQRHIVSSERKPPVRVGSYKTKQQRHIAYNMFKGTHNVD